MRARRRDRVCFFFQAEDGIRDVAVTGVRTCALPILADIRALFTQDPDALEDPDCYPLARDATQIDLRPAVREELLLAAPQWVVCREDRSEERRVGKECRSRRSPDH